jgi:glycosyltransferase involved in cell wall biosynthesis
VNILFVVKHFPCLSQTFILNEIRALRAHGCDVRVLSALKLDEDVELDALTASSVTYLQHGSLYRYGVTSESAGDQARIAALPGALDSDDRGVTRDERQHLWELLQALDPDPGVRARGFFDAVDTIALIRAHHTTHLHCDFAEDNVGLAHLVSQVTGVPFTFKMRAYDIFAEPHPRLPVWAAAAAQVFTISHYNRDYICRQWGFDPGIVTVCYDGVSAEQARPIAEYVHEPFRLVSISRLVEKKGFPILMDACRLLQGQVPFHCDIYGDGPEKAALDRQVADLGLGGCVTLHGRRPHADVLDALEQASVFVLACVQAANGDRDGTPNALLEAMARGVPVVSTRLSGIPEIIEDQVTGLLVPAGDAPALAEAILRLATDRELAETLRRTGQQAVTSQFTIARTAGGFLEALGAGAAG